MSEQTDYQSIRVAGFYATFAAMFLIGCVLLLSDTWYYFVPQPDRPRWREWQSPEMRDFCDAIRESHLDDENKALLEKLVWNKSAWDSGLIRRLVEPLTLKRIVWQSSFRNNSGRLVRVFLLDAFVRPTAGMPIPPVCVITDEDYNLVAWKAVAGFSIGFVNATLSEGEDPVLTITTFSNWFRGTGTYITVRHGCCLLDAWNLKRPSVSAEAIETELAEEVPKLMAALDEAEDAATSSGNHAVVELVRRTRELYNLLAECVEC